METPRPTGPNSPHPRRSRSILARQFGQSVRTHRLRCGISQEDLAHRAKMHPAQISLIECGKRSARLETICVLAAALGVQPAELVPRIG